MYQQRVMNLPAMGDELTSNSIVKKVDNKLFDNEIFKFYKIEFVFLMAVRMNKKYLQLAWKLLK